MEVSPSKEHGRSREVDMLWVWVMGVTLVNANSYTMSALGPVFYFFSPIIYITIRGAKDQAATSHRGLRSFLNKCCGHADVPSM